MTCDQSPDRPDFSDRTSPPSTKNTELDRIVAIKIPRREQLTEADAEKVLREARAAVQVRHPNIVSVREVGRIYIASDFIAGASLDEWISAHPVSRKESGSGTDATATGRPNLLLGLRN